MTIKPSDENNEVSLLNFFTVHHDHVATTCVSVTPSVNSFCNCCLHQINISAELACMRYVTLNFLQLPIHNDKLIPLKRKSFSVVGKKRLVFDHSVQLRFLTIIQYLAPLLKSYLVGPCGHANTFNLPFMYQITRSLL